MVEMSLEYFDNIRMQHFGMAVSFIGITERAKIGVGLVTRDQKCP